VNNYHIFSPLISKKVKLEGRGNIEIGPFTVIEDYVLLESGSCKKSSIIIGSRSKLKQGVIIRTYDGTVKIGDRVSIGEYTNIAGHGGVSIGNNTIVAGHCYISAANHIFVDSEEKIRFQGETAEGIDIKDNVWIGGGVMVLDGVTIGSGCVIGAGSVVTEDIPPKTLSYGIPCRVIEKLKKPLWIKEGVK